MGDYNSYSPTILGQEWVPIRDENQVFSPAVNTVEVGHGFTLATSRTLATARFYINQLPPARVDHQVTMAAIYPRGAEDLSGPIRSVIIPCNSGGVTGNGFNSLTAANIPIFLANPGDGSFIQCTPNTDTASKRLDLFFATGSYAQLLNGKRILAVNLLHSFSWDPFESGVPGSVAGDRQVYTITQDFGIETGTGSTLLTRFAPLIDTYGNNLIGLDPPRGRPPQAIPMSVVHFGEINHMWSNPSTTITTERMPWRYDELARFEASSGANRYRVHYEFGGITEWAGVFYLNYAALQVIYCEEQRIAYGAKAFGGSVGSTLTAQYVQGANLLTMRDRSLTANPILAAGDYTVVASSPNIGDLTGPIASEITQPAQDNTYPTLNAVRELYAIPAHPGVQVNIPVPIEDHFGDTFTQTVTHILPQLSLHTSGGTMTEPHAYGRQIAAQVYGANTATQDIYDDISGTAADYPQVRFYARRFGDTSVPLTLTGVGGLSASTVSLTPAEYDALTDIIDGWKEVTLRFTTAPSMGAVAGNPAWTWSAVGETAGNRWEILGACAPAVSGIPGDLFNQVPTADRLGVATYQPPAGDTVELTWMPQGCSSPYVSGASADPAVDAVLIFSQDPNPVTGVSLSQLTQTVTGIGLLCGSLPCCIPSGIAYNRITWGLPVNTGIASDDFNRVVAAGGWGTASDGHVWTTSGTAANFSVDGAEGLIAPSALNASRLAWVDVGGPDQDVTCLERVNDVAESGNLVLGVTARLTDASNYYVAEFRTSATDTSLLLRRRVGGVTTDLISVTTLLLPAATAWRWIRLQVQGNKLRAKVWGLGDPEPDWMVSYTDATPLSTGNNAGVIARDNTAAAAPSTMMYDSFSVAPPDWGFGGLELQRFDYLTGTFETIMLASSPTVTGFNDYEARVGVDSVYRIRNLNVYNFAGPWSTQVTGAPPTPGVTGGCADATGALIFTSNADQTGHSNAAYVMQWENTPDEVFSLPEADDVVFQPMYGRDGRVAFHGTERGLESFDRTLLIQAAAIDPIRLADVKTLRDLAWNDLPYICVRDDIGDRWYANVRVPVVNARHNRTSYMARVSIVETTTEPFAVDP